MAAHGFFWKGARTLRDEMSVLQTNDLFVQAGIADNGRRDLRVVGLDNTDSVFSQILMADLKGSRLRHGLDHVRIQQTQPVGAAGNLVSHLHKP